MISSRPVRKLGDIQQASNSKWSVSLQLKVIAMAWLGRRPRRSVGGTENPLREAMRFGHPDRQPGVFHVGLIGSSYLANVATTRCKGVWLPFGVYGWSWQVWNISLFEDFEEGERI